MMFFINSGKQRTHISFIVGNKIGACVKVRAVLVSVHKQISVVFAYKNELFFLVH